MENEISINNNKNNNKQLFIKINKVLNRFNPKEASGHIQ